MRNQEQDEQEGTRGFRVEDRRSFDSQGSRRKPPENEAPETGRQADPPGDPAPEGEAGDVPAGDVPLDTPFLRIVGGMVAGALSALGMMQGPSGEEARVDLPAAREFIDLLGVLEEKTRGNLEPGEKELLVSHLHQLRLIYLQKAEEAR